MTTMATRPTTSGRKTKKTRQMIYSFAGGRAEGRSIGKEILGGGEHTGVNEVVMDPARPLRLYYDRTDHRLHLLGKERAEGWLDVDYDLDGKVDARYTYTDDNGEHFYATKFGST